jgi:ribosomal protein S18 acetylase RimI-like enzyme
MKSLITPTTMFRSATVNDCYTIAQLFRIASDGVADYIWSTLTDDYPGLTPVEIGATRYASEESLFSYKNCVLAERNGNPIGMMLTFPIAESEHPETPLEDKNNPEKNDTNAEPITSNEPDVLAPYGLEALGSWYICALALFPEFRGQGIGTQFLAIANQQAAARGFSELSLLCFEQNTRAFKLYQRHGFSVIDRTEVVPHPLIHHTGDILLMTAAVQV